MIRIALQVLTAYGLLLILGVVWSALPFGRAAPDVVSLFAVYLGLTARYRVAPSMTGAIISGYLADLLMGTPRGLLALTAGIACLVAHLIQGRLLVRGPLFTLIFSASTGMLAGLFVLMIRAITGLLHGGVGPEIGVLVVSALLTGLAGPLVFRICRAVDGRLARTERDRAAFEGLLR